MERITEKEIQVKGKRKTRDSFSLQSKKEEPKCGAPQLLDRAQNDRSRQSEYFLLSSSVTLQITITSCKGELIFQGASKEG